MTPESSVAGIDLQKAVGIIFAAAVHAVVLWGLWQHRLIPGPADAATLFVKFIAPPATEKKDEPRRPQPKPAPTEKPQPRQIVAETAVLAPTDFVAPSSPAKPVPAAVIEAPQMPLPAGPVVMSAELSVACPERSAPAYPVQSRRLGETGIVVLRVELAETGHVAAAHVQSSSGHLRLDDVALAAVKTWRCTPAQRNGQAVRAVALQPFRFILQGS